MPSGSINPPTIVPLCVPKYIKGRQVIDANTLVELSSNCYDSNGDSSSFETCHYYFTVDGTKPEPFESWKLNWTTFKYTKPFTFNHFLKRKSLNHGSDSRSTLRTIKALAVDERMINASVVVTKDFNVVDADTPINNQGSIQMEKEIVIRETKDFDVVTSIAREVQPLESTFESMVIAEVEISDNVVEKLETIPNFTDGTNIEVVDSKVLVLDTKLETYDGDPKTAVIADDYLPDLNTQSSMEETNSPPRKNFYGQFGFSKKMNDKEVQVISLVNDKQVQTDMKISDELTKSVSEICKMDRETQTLKIGIDIVVDQRRINAETQTGPRIAHAKKVDKEECLERAESILTPEPRSITFTEKKDDFKRKQNQVSSGRGFWRQQMDYIASTLKAEAYNNMDFRKSISEHRVTKLNRVSVHEGLDNLVLVANFQLKSRPLFSSVNDNHDENGFSMQRINSGIQRI